MGSHRSLKYIAAVAAFAATPAFAADLPPIVEPPLVPPILEDVSGWYIRGDIGYVDYDDPDVTFGNGKVHFEKEDLDDTFLVGAGFGYKFNKFLRGDITIDYRFESDFSGGTRCFSCSGVQFSREESAITTWTGLVNGYLDLGYFHGFSPYVGGGVGFAHVAVDDVFGVNPDGSTTNLESNSETNFAYALMAGVSYAFSDHLILDANYRYVDFGEVETDPDVNGDTVEFDDLTANEFRVGLRYVIY